jgi:hypothetical protein
MSFRSITLIQRGSRATLYRRRDELLLQQILFRREFGELRSQFFLNNVRDSPRLKCQGVSRVPFVFALTDLRD